MLTVICSSRFGTGTLPRVLTAYEDLELPRGGWQLIVVDGSGSGRTSAILKAYATRLPLTVVRKAKDDASGAIQAALRSAAGDLVVFTDERSVPAPNWLSSLRDAADRRTEFAVFAGSILPCWEGTPEPTGAAWHEQGAIYALTEPRSDEGPIAPELVWAPNVAVRAEILSGNLRATATLGRHPRDLAHPAAESLVDGICAAAHRTWYVPQAVVRHGICDWRSEGPWIKRPALRRGRAMASLELEQQARRLRGALRASWSATRLLGKRQLGVWRARLSGDLSAAFRARWRRDLALGKLLEHQRHWFCGKTG